MQVSWSARVEETIKKGAAALKYVETRTQGILEMLADRVLTDLTKDIRQKYEQLITDMVHQRDVTRRLISEDIKSVAEFNWLYHMRFYFNTKVKQTLEKL
jgi:dynein heavy chain 1